MTSTMKYFASLLCLVIFAAVPRVNAAPVDAGMAVVDLVSDHAVTPPGSTVRGALTLDIDDHWHVYWKNAGDSGLPAEILWDETSGAETGAFEWPIPHPQPIETLMNYGFEERLVLPFDIKLPDNADGELVLSGTAQYLICKDICIPEEAPVSLRLTIGDAPIKSLAGDAFAWADARMPVPLQGEAALDRSEGETWKLSIRDDSVRAAFDGDVSNVRFFPADHQILHPPEQPVSLGPEGVTLTLQEAVGLSNDGPLSGVLAIEDVGGNRIGFELTASSGSVIAGTAGESLETSSALSDTAGEALSFAALLGVLGAALLGGAILNLMPCVLPVLFIKARSLLALHGHQDQSHMRQHGVFYLVGVVVCFLGFGLALALLRAAGEQVGLGFQLQFPAVVAGLSLLMFVLALNMLGMFDFGSSLMGVGSGLAERGGNTGAFFTGVLAAFVGAPCIGPFIGAATGVVVTQPLPIILLVFLFLGLGMALPFALLSFFPGLFWALPKPGPWMERVKQFFAFPLFLTALWLIWVLGLQAGVNAVALTGVGAILIAFAIWLWNVRPDTGSARQVLMVVALLVGGLGIAAPIWQLSASGADEAGNTSQSAALSGSDVYEGEWSPKKVEQLRSEGRAIFVDFTASWCVTCQVNKQTTLRNARVQAAFSDANVAVLIADWTKRDKLIGAELAKHGRAGVPLYLYYGTDGGEPEILPQILSPDLVVDTISRS